MANVVKAGSATGAKAQNAEWFASDLVPAVLSDYASKYRIMVAVSLAVTLEVTLDSGTTWVLLNSAVAIGAEQLFIFDVPALTADNFNLRTPTVGGTTIRYCRVDEVLSEA